MHLRLLPAARPLLLRRACSASAASGGSEAAPTPTPTPRAAVEEWEEEYRALRQGWDRKHNATSPFFQPHGFKLEQHLPRPRSGQHVVDIAGLLSATPDAAAQINDACRAARSAAGVNVVFLLLGDIGSHTSRGLAQLLGNHWTRHGRESGEDPGENLVLVVVSRKNGTLDTYVGWGVAHAFHPLWVRQQFNKTFKVYFRGREWDTKLLEYAEALRARAEAKQGSFSRTGRRAWVNQNFVYLLAGAVVGLMLLHDVVLYTRFWRERRCEAHGERMVASTDNELLEKALSPVQLVEHRNECVEFDLWRCPTKGCGEHHYSERVWNDLRKDCLRCRKCGGRCSVGTRAVVNTADTSSRGEVLNSRACRYCGFQEAWTSLLSPGVGTSDGVTRATAGNYGSEAWVTFSNSLVGRFVLRSRKADAELQEGVGRIGGKDTGANLLRPQGFFFSP